jgi:hypothetical protein
MPKEFERKVSSEVAFAGEVNPESCQARAGLLMPVPEYRSYV